MARPKPLPQRMPVTFRPAACRRVVMLVLAACALAGCTREPESPLPTEQFVGDLDQIRQRKVLRALVVPSRTDFFLTGARIEGLQARMLLAYEKYLNAQVKRAEEKVRIRFLPVTFDRLLPELEAGRGDVAAAMLTLTPEREARVTMVSARTMEVDEVVVRHRGAEPVRQIEDLSGREVHVLRGSSYAEHLRKLNTRLGYTGRTPVQVREAEPWLHSEDIMELVNAGVVQLTVIDDYKAKLWSQLFDNVVVQDDVLLHEGGHVGWAVRKDNPALAASLQAFLDTVKPGTTLGNVLRQSFLGQTRWITNPTSAVEQATLDRLWPLFERYGNAYGIDPLALLAQAFHESGLDQTKRSARGAIGLMQLLPSTARDPNVGIPNIQIAENNLHAGAKYLAFLRNHYYSNPDIDPQARMAFAWAAYNAGPGRVQQMRESAARLGLDPNRWFGHVEVAAGRLFGRETVKYVADVNKYLIAYRLLREHQAARQAGS